MNYGDKSELTDADRSDLKKLYKSAWSGQLTNINGTPIKFVRPFHYLGM
jgi:adenylylsulfate kinase-like enzyme